MGDFATYSNFAARNERDVSPVAGHNRKTSQTAGRELENARAVAIAARKTWFARGVIVAYTTGL